MATAAVQRIDPRRIQKNPENPRLIFHQDELDALQKSIATQGILVPLAVYMHGDKYVLLDGERRWRCAVKLSLPRVPVIVQPQPDRLQNILMMFAIHNARRDWDPLPTAYKLRELEQEYQKRNGRPPSETELAQLASLERGEVRRLRQLLGLPAVYREELMEELKKPRSEQVLTVDHVLETTKGVAALEKRGIVTADTRDEVRRAIISKFRSKVETNTVAPRQLSRIARAVDRNEIPVTTARKVVTELVKNPKFTIGAAFASSIEHVDFEHGIEQLVQRLEVNLRTHAERRYPVGPALREALMSLVQAISRFLK